MYISVRCADEGGVIMQRCGIKNWDAVPRDVMRIGASSGYEDAVEKYLNEKGLAGSSFHIESIIQVDLEGDGITETLVSAYHGEDPMAPSENDYSFVLILREIDSQSVVQPLLEWTHDSVPDIMVLDTNGDGRMEIFVFTTYNEGKVTYMFTVSRDEISCPLYCFYGF